MRAKPLNCLPIAELSAMRLDGEIWRPSASYASWCSISDPDSSTVRAASVAHLVDEDEVIYGAAAHWIYGVGDAPERIEIASVRTGEARRSVDTVRHQRIYAPDERALVGGVQVATPLRLACDCVLDKTREPREAMRLLARLGVRPPEVIEWLDANPRRSGAKRARAMLAAMASAS